MILVPLLFVAGAVAQRHEEIWRWANNTLHSILNADVRPPSI
jgi:hypothetical protein